LSTEAAATAPPAQLGSTGNSSYYWYVTSIENKKSIQNQQKKKTKTKKKTTATMHSKKRKTSDHRTKTSLDKDSELEAMSKLLEDTNKKMDNLKAEKELVEEHMEAKEAQIKLLELERDNLEEEKDCFEEQVFRLGLQVEGSEIEVETAAKQVKTLEHQVETLKIKLDEKNDTINKWREKIECLKGKNKKDSEEKEAENALLVHKLRLSKAAHAREVKHLDDEVEALKTDKLELDNENKKLKSENERLRRRSSTPPGDKDILNGLDKELIEQINNQIVDDSEEVTFNDIAGLENAKKTVNELVTYPMQRPDLFTGLRACPKGLLLFGPPGTGMLYVCYSSATIYLFTHLICMPLTMIHYINLPQAKQWLQRQ